MVRSISRPLKRAAAAEALLPPGVMTASDACAATPCSTRTVRASFAERWENSQPRREAKVHRAEPPRSEVHLRRGQERRDRQKRKTKKVFKWPPPSHWSPLQRLKQGGGGGGFRMTKTSSSAAGAGLRVCPRQTGTLQQEEMRGREGREGRVEGLSKRGGRKEKSAR